MENKEKNNFWIWICIVLAIGFILLLYYASLGQYDPTKRKSDLDLENRKRLAELRHKKLEKLICRKIELKKRLDKIFRRAYLFVRILIISFIVFLNWIYHKCYDVMDVSSFITFNEGLLIVFVAITFLVFGTIMNLESMLEYFKQKLENRVYNKYLDIDDQIKKNQKESEELAMLIKEFDEEIKRNKNS